MLLRRSHDIGLRQAKNSAPAYKNVVFGCRRVRLGPCRASHALPAVMEVARRVLESPATPSVSTSIIQAAPHGATTYFISLCGLSVCLGAMMYRVFNLLQQMMELQGAGAKALEAPLVYYGVDVTNSRFFMDQRVLAAMEFAAQAHAGQVRKTGEPYVSHCIETAVIVEHNLPPAAEYERYTLAMMAALLHDVVDDTSVDLAAIQAKFGPTVASMVAKISKLSQMNQLLRRGKRKGWAEYSPEHFKSLRKMIVDMVFEEPLVILVKLADRLHNMRTVFVLKPDKQRAVAEETLEVWCTMAECLGWDALKSEMEDLCFAVLQPEQYCALRAQLDRIWALPSLKVVEEQADSSSLPANAMAPAPPLTARGRRAAAAAEARREAANARSVARKLALEAAEAEDRAVNRGHPRMSLGALLSALGARGGRAGETKSAVAAGVAAASGVLAVAGGRGATSGSCSSSVATAAVASAVDEDDLNLGIRIVACPREVIITPCSGPEGQDVPCTIPSINTVDGSDGNSGSVESLSSVSAEWDLVSWHVGSSKAPGAGAQAPAAGDVHVQSLQVLQSSNCSNTGQAGAGAREPGAVAGATSSGSSSSGAASGPASSITDADLEQLQRQLRRLQSHAEAGPGPLSGSSAALMPVSAGISSSVASSTSTVAPVAVAASTSAAAKPVGKGVREREEGVAPRPEQEPAPRTRTFAASSGGGSSSSNHSSSGGSGSTHPNQGQPGAADAKASAKAPGKPQPFLPGSPLASQMDRLSLDFADSDDEGSALPGSSPAGGSLPAPTASTSGPSPQQGGLSGLPMFDTRFLPPGLAAFFPRISGSTSSTTGSGVGAAALTSASSTGGVAAGATAVASGPAKQLSQQQERLRSLVSTVVPFDSVNFKDTRGLAMSMRRGLEVLDECAELLYSEVQLRSAVGGLQLTIQGRLKSLHSVYRKMVRKNCSVAQVYDARALRVIVDDEGGARSRDAVETVYKLVSVVHSIWKPIPQEFDDYIANPKPSGYQALHTAVKGPGGIPMEVQIKTSSMHHLAEYGAAAHWVYKEYSGGVAPGPPTAGKPPAIKPAVRGRHGGSPVSTPMLPLPVSPLMPTAPSPSLRTQPGAGKSQGSSTAAVATPAGVAVATAAGAQQAATAPAPPAPGPRPQPAAPRGKGWVGQPVLRIAKDKLRYGVVIASEGQGTRLVVAVKLGATMEAYPARVPDYSFYRSMLDYTQARHWVIPGHGDFTLRLEEFVMANDGRLHRKDHMGYVMPAETLTMLEGYEEEAELAESAAAAVAAAAAVVPAADAAAAGVALPVGAASRSLSSNAPQPHYAPTSASSAPAPAEEHVADPASGMAEAVASAPALPQPSVQAVPVDRAAERFRRQMQEAYLRTQQLRTMIEWGRSAMGRYHPGGCEPGDEVSVLIWPGGAIEHWPRGTTVGEVANAKGVITLGNVPEPREVRPSATALWGGEDGWLTNGAYNMGSGNKPLVNVNNRLVPEDTLLNDGDLVILTREKVKI